jgi:uncharacterized protein with HEPN domain
VTREHWDAEDILRDAVLYRMPLLGEIASVLPDELRDRYPDVAWRQIRAFRNLAVHKYFGVDWAVVWKIAGKDRPSWRHRCWRFFAPSDALAELALRVADSGKTGPRPGPAAARRASCNSAHANPVGPGPRTFIARLARVSSLRLAQ